MSDPGFDVVVVGNGAVGLTSATAVARRIADAKVAVVGPAGREGGASSAAAAMLGCFAEVTRHTLSSVPGRAKFDLQLAAHRRWKLELEELGEHGGASLTEGTFVILNGQGGGLDSENFDAMLAALRAHDAPHEPVSEVPGLAPTPDARPLRCVHLPDEGSVDSTLLLRSLERRALSAGVRLLDARVVRLIEDGERVRGIELDDGTRFMASVVILATGAFTSPILEPLGGVNGVQPILAGSGMAIVASRVMGEGFTSTVRSVTRAGSCGLHVVPLGGGEGMRATNVLFAEPELRAHLGITQFLTECAINQLDRNLSYSRIDEIRMGNRPVSLDTFPLLGPGPRDGLWILTGSYRDGLHAAPEIAAILAESILDGRSAFPQVFDPCRTPLSTMSVEESIEDFVAQQVASAFEGGTRLSPFLDTGDLASMVRPKAEALYQRLDRTTGLAPDLVSFLCLTRKADSDVDRVAQYLKAIDS